MNGYNVGTLNNSGEVSEKAGNLTLTGNSTLSLTPGDSTQYAIFSGFTPGSSTLVINGWTGSPDASLITGGQLLFPVSGWDSAKLSSIIFGDFNGVSNTPAGTEVFGLDPNFYTIVPAAVPEPTTVYTGAALLGVAIVNGVWRKRRSH